MSFDRVVEEARLVAAAPTPTWSPAPGMGFGRDTPPGCSPPENQPARRTADVPGTVPGHPTGPRPNLLPALGFVAWNRRTGPRASPSKNVPIGFLPCPTVDAALDTERQADALVALAQDSLDGNQTDGTTTAPIVSIFEDAELAGRTNGETGATIDTGPRIGPLTLEEILCDGSVEILITARRRDTAVGRTHRPHHPTQAETIHPPSRRWGMHSRRLPIPLPAPTPPHHPPQPGRYSRSRQLDHLVLVPPSRRYPPQRLPHQPKQPTPTATIPHTRRTRPTLTQRAIFPAHVKLKQRTQPFRQQTRAPTLLAEADSALSGVLERQENSAPTSGPAVPDYGRRWQRRLTRRRQRRRARCPVGRSHPRDGFPIEPSGEIQTAPPPIAGPIASAIRNPLPPPSIPCPTAMARTEASPAISGQLSMGPLGGKPAVWLKTRPSVDTQKVCLTGSVRPPGDQAGSGSNHGIDHYPLPLADRMIVAQLGPPPSVGGDPGHRLTRTISGKPRVRLNRVGPSPRRQRARG